MLSSARLLIVEGEFLIALDIQRVLESAGVSQTLLARDFDEVAKLGERLGEFDLAIVTPPRDADDHATAMVLAKSCPAIVVVTAAGINLAGSALRLAETVDKPFRDEELLAACERALAARR